MVFLKKTVTTNLCYSIGFVLSVVIEYSFATCDSCLVGFSCFSFSAVLWKCAQRFFSAVKIPNFVEMVILLSL